MDKLFKDAPFNTKQVYVKAMDKSGCKIYLPVNAHSQLIQDSKLKELKQFLAGQPLPDLPEPSSA